MKFINKYKYHILSFLIPLLILIVYIVSQKVLLFNLITADLREQYIFLFDYFKDVLDGTSSIFYHFGRGLGGSMYGTFFYYLSCPLNLVLVFSNKNNIYLFLLGLIFLKISLCGLTMYIYLSKSNKNDKFINLLLAILYSLMTYNLVYYYQMMWLDVTYLAPLVVLGLDRIIQNKKSTCYIIFLFLCILCNYYISYMLCLFLCIYFIFRIITKYNIKKDKKKIKEITKKFMISSLLAGLLASFVIFPVLYELKNTYRSEVFFDYDLILNPFNSIARFGIVESDYNYYVKFFPHIFCGFIPIIIIINYFMKVRDKNKKYVAYIFTFFFLSFILPPFIKLWHGLEIPYHLFHRWSFLFSLFMIIIASEKYKKIKIFSLKEIFKISIFYYLLITLSILFSSVDKFNIYLLFVNFLLFLLTFIFMNYVKINDKLFYKSMLFIVTIVSIYTLMYFEFEVNYTRTVNSDMKEFNLSYQNREKFRKQLSSLNKEYYRVGGNLKYTTNESFGIINGRNTLFLSINPKNLIQFYLNSGFISTANEYLDTESQVVLNPLLGIQYWYGNTEDENYELFKEGDTKILKNKYKFSLGYIVNYNKVKVNYSNPFEYQNSLFKMIYGKPVWKKYKSDELDNDVYFYVKDLICDKNEYMYITTDNETIDYCTVWGIKKIDINSIKKIDVDNKDITDDDFILYSIDKNVANEMLENLSKKQINITKIEKNKLNFTIDSEKNDTLLLTIPYDKGWKIYVDGKEANYFELMDTFIGLKLNKGKHHVKMVYYPKYLTFGIIVSCIDLICLILYLKSDYKIGNK